MGETDITKFIDKSGKEYKYHEIFNSGENSITILSSDGVAFRIYKDILQRSSPVFRSMFSTCSTATDNIDQTLTIDYKSATLAIFFSIISDRPIKLAKSDYENFLKTIKLCEIYDVPSYLVVRLLFQSIRPIDIFGFEQSYHIFRIAAKYNDIFTASKLIANVGKYGSLEGQKYSKFWAPQKWDEDSMKVLPGNWAWAYMCAHHTSAAQATEEDYWLMVSARFVQCLTS